MIVNQSGIYSQHQSINLNYPQINLQSSYNDLGDQIQSRTEVQSNVSAVQPLYPSIPRFMKQASHKQFSSRNNLYGCYTSRKSKQPPCTTGKSMLRVISEGSLVRTQGSSIKQYNRSVLEKSKENPFESHNIASEIINKPISKHAHLENAESISPYLNPNKF